MIRLGYSNATEELLDALAAAIRDERRAGNALQPVRLVVPNANIETYVKLGLAERMGIAAHLEVTFLRRFLARIAERAFPRARAVDADLIEGCLLAVFHDDDALAAPALEPVRHYLLAGGAARDAIDRRRCQLAGQLGRLFDEYASSRAKMLADWRAAPDDQHAVTTEASGAGERGSSGPAACSRSWARAPAPCTCRWRICWPRPSSTSTRTRSAPLCTCSASRTWRPATTACWRCWLATSTSASTR